MTRGLVILLCILYLDGAAQDSAFQYALYARVDVYNSDGSPKGKGWISGFVNKKEYKVHLLGCTDHNDEIFDTSRIKGSLMPGIADPDLKALTGKWNLLMYEYPGDYQPGPQSPPPLEINADGTYTWYDVYNKPPFITNWVACGKIAGAKQGSTHSYNGVLIIDRYQQVYKVFTDKQDHVILQRLCSEGMKEGTRIK